MFGRDHTHIYIKMLYMYMYAIRRNMYAIYTDHVLIVPHVFTIIAYIGDNPRGIPNSHPIMDMARM